MSLFPSFHSIIAFHGGFFSIETCQKNCFPFLPCHNVFSWQWIFNLFSFFIVRYLLHMKVILYTKTNNKVITTVNYSGYETKHHYTIKATPPHSVISLLPTRGKCFMKHSVTWLRAFSLDFVLPFLFLNLCWFLLHFQLLYLYWHKQA